MIKKHTCITRKTSHAAHSPVTTHLQQVVYLVLLLCVVFSDSLTLHLHKGLVVRNYYYLTNHKFLQMKSQHPFFVKRKCIFSLCSWLHKTVYDPIYRSFCLQPTTLIILVFFIVFHGTFIHRRDAPHVHKGKNRNDLSSNKFLGPLLEIFHLLGCHFWLLSSAGS